MTADPSAAIVREAPAAGASACLLALSTASEWCSVALHRRAEGVDDSECLSERLGAGQSMRVLAMVRELLDAVQRPPSAIDAIAFDAGPGAFTGLRVGCAVAQGLGFALDRPLLPVDGLATLAWQRLRGTRIGDATVLVANDARIGELYVALYRVRFGADGASPLLATLMEPRVLARAELHTLPGLGAAAPRASELLLAGNAWGLPGLLDDWVARQGLAAPPQAPADDDAYVRADALAELALLAWRAGGGLDPALAAPRYVRDKVALDRGEQRALRAQRDGRASGSVPGAGR